MVGDCNPRAVCIPNYPLRSHLTAVRSIVYLGSIRRPLVTHDPSPSDLLPSDDAPWDQGVCDKFPNLFQKLWTKLTTTGNDTELSYQQPRRI